MANLLMSVARLTARAPVQQQDPLYSVREEGGTMKGAGKKRPPAGLVETSMA